MKENELKEESNLSVYDDDSELMSLYEPQTPIDDLLKRANSNRMSVNKKPNPHDFQEEDDDALLERSNLRPQPRNPTYYGRRDSWSGQKPSHQQKGPHQKTKSFHDEGNISERSPNHMRDPSAEYVSPFLRTIPCTKPNQYQQGEEEQHCDLPREEEIIYNSSNLHAYGRKAMPPEGETPIARPTSGLQMSQTPAEEAPPLGTPPETPLYRPSVATAPPTRPPPPIPAKKPSGTIASREPAMPSRGETSATTKPTIQSSVPKESLPQETPLGQPSVAATPPARPPPAIRVWKLPDAATPMKASSPSSKGHVKGPDLTFNRSSLPSKTGLPVPSQSPSKPEANAESWQRDTRTRQSGTPRPQALDPPASLPKREASSTEVSAEPRQRDARTRQTEPTSRETFHSLASLPRREASTTQATAEPRQRDTRTKQSEPASPQSFDPSASSPRREVSPTEANSEARQRDTRTRQSYATPEAFDPPASLSRREASSTQANAKPRQRDTHRRQSETTSPQAFDPSASLPRREASSTEAKTEPRQRDTRRGQSEPTIPQTFDPPASLPRREASSTQANAESRQRDTRTKQSEPAIPQAFDPSADSPRREALSSEAKAEPRRRDTRRAEPATSQAFDPPASSPARPAPEVIGRPAQGPCKFPHVDEIAANLEALRLQRMKK
ncbi:hypothetical protein KP509_15G054700 [Ceratopteris richardii]|nr:hypothetical protein KP509_15G054700 [Ceratopteris richardii]